MSSGTESSSTESSGGRPPRPGPWQWTRYAFGAGLPHRFDEWVLHDVTGPTWVLRHLSRAIFQLAPVIILLAIFVPGPAWIRLVMVLAGGVLALIYSVAYLVEATDHRLVKAGYASGAAEQVRRRRSTAAQYEALMRRRAKAEARRVARGR